MTDAMFDNSHIISWLKYFSENTKVDLEHVKILDITKKNKNLIPTVEAHRCVLVFTEAGHPDIFYKMYMAGLGECEVIYNEGSEPHGPIKSDKVSNMIDRGINASAGMIILNPTNRSTVKFGMDNAALATGSVRYVGAEIRSVILSKMQIIEGKNICVISGESIVVEASKMDGEGSIIAVEYNSNDRKTLEENVDRFGLENVTIIDHVDEENMKGLAVPDVTMLVSSASMEQEMEYMISINPNMEFVIYTLDFVTAAQMPALCARLGIRDPEIIQISVSRLTTKNTYKQEPAPWLITCKAGE
ncbi:MAG: precorrin-6B methylase [Lachnospiraceae bacterium]|nr:precorrin-6B methylase [Lachnospiraceae bacterium]